MQKKFFKATIFLSLFLMISSQCFSQEQGSQSSIRIEEAVICRDVVDKTPVEAGDVFPKGLAKLYCFCRVVGAEEETEIIHNWYYGGDLIASVALPVRSANWRTYSSKKLLPEYFGEFKVEILSEEGEILQKIIFLVK